jgi:hypothetical protein
MIEEKEWMHGQPVNIRLKQFTICRFVCHKCEKWKIASLKKKQIFKFNIFSKNTLLVISVCETGTYINLTPVLATEANISGINTTIESMCNIRSTIVVNRGDHI